MGLLMSDAIDPSSLGFTNTDPDTGELMTAQESRQRAASSAASSYSSPGRKAYATGDWGPSTSSGNDSGPTPVPSDLAASMGFDAQGNLTQTNPAAKLRAMIDQDLYFNKQTGRETTLDAMARAGRIDPSVAAALQGSAASGRGRGRAAAPLTADQVISQTNPDGGGGGADDSMPSFPGNYGATAPTNPRDAATIAASNAFNGIAPPSMSPAQTVAASNQANGVTVPSVTTDDSTPKSPEDYFRDPMFQARMREDLPAAARLYNSTTGRDFKTDYMQIVATEKARDKFNEGVVDKLVKSGLNFDPITGQAQTLRVVADKSAMALPGSDQMKEEYRDLSSVEQQIVAKHYTNVTGMPLPQGIKTPQGQPLTPAEAMQFRQSFQSEVMKQVQQGKLPDYRKNPQVLNSPQFMAVYNTVWKNMHQSQAATAAVSTNPAAVDANPPNFMERMAVKTANAASTVGWNTVDTMANLLQGSVAPQAGTALHNMIARGPDRVQYSDFRKPTPPARPAPPPLSLGDRRSDLTLEDLVR